MMRFLVARLRAFTAAPQPVTLHIRPTATRSLAMLGLCALVVSGCVSSDNSSGSLGPGGGDGINDAALGVAASPRVTDQARDLPRGGGRAQIGRPYRIAGRLYTPRADPTYDRVGVASWYGDAFHGRLTANGEVYDMHTLSAAHPTLPLPSYVRVTNTENDRSVIVRVNDRGPFSRNRIIDLSRRAADVLDFRNDGVARVRVQYLEQARMDGQDVEWLEASAQINGVPLNGADTGTMFAQAPTPPAPAPTPAPAQQATAFVATSDARTPAATPTTPRAALAGITPTRASAAPLDLTPRAAISVLTPSASTTPTFAPTIPGSDPNAPIPSGTVGFTATPVTQASLQDGFQPRNQSSLALNGRIEIAHRRAAASALDAASQLALQSQTLTHLEPSRPAVSQQSAPTRTATVQIGLFADPENVERLRTALERYGSVVTQPIRSGSRTLTQVRLRAPISSADDAQLLLRQLAGQGYTDAYLTDPTDA